LCAEKGTEGFQGGSQKVRLLPVVNRGMTYPVPTEHLDNAINSADPIKIAEMSVEFYKK
jgi:hypothetical protein